MADRATLHVVSLPWTTTTPDYVTCAYTMKVLKLGQMMTGRSRRVVLYTGGEANTAPCDEHVAVLSDSQREALIGAWTPDMVTKGSLTWDPNHPIWALFNAGAIEAIRARIQPRDLILLTGGNCQRVIAAAFPHPNHIVCEWAVGYEGIFTNYCAFESHVWRHHVYGLAGWRHGRAYDTVVPNFFDPADFYLSDKKDYLVFLGRITGSKGPHVAWQIAQAVGMPLVVAGPGGLAIDRDGGTFLSACDNSFDPFGGPGLTYLGAVNPAQRAYVLSHARACLMPTQYVEPFGGVAVEAMMSGTPVVASDWGAFVETVTYSRGRRFSTLAEGVEAVEYVRKLDPADIRLSASLDYSLAAVAPQFDRWFAQLDGLWGEGWSALPSALPADRTVTLPETVQPVVNCSA